MKGKDEIEEMKGNVKTKERECEWRTRKEINRNITNKRMRMKEKNGIKGHVQTKAKEREWIEMSRNHERWPLIECREKGRELLDYRTYHKCLGKQLDIYFILDASTSIYSEHFERIQELVRHIVTKLSLGDRSTRIVGMLTYSDDVQSTPPPLQLKTVGSKMEIVDRISIDNLPHMKGKTETYKAIRYVRLLQDSEFRKEAQNVMVILTDGGSHQPEMTAEEAELARRKGFLIYVIGVGIYLEPNEWTLIASDPDSEYVFNVSKSSQPLLPVVNSFLDSLCGASVALCNVHNAANLYFIAGPGGASRAYHLIDTFAADTMVTSQGLLRVGYIFDHCNCIDKPLARAETYCGEYKYTECLQYPASSKTYQTLLKKARDYARWPRMFRSQVNQVAVLFVDDESIIENWRDINNLVAENINLIIVDLGVRYCFTNFLKEIPQNMSNYIRIVGDVESQEYLKERLTKLICQAINDRYGCVPTV
ncbi:cartilage matrix protein isoform X2, partial [Biomphalaria glabrata]